MISKQRRGRTPPTNGRKTNKRLDCEASLEETPLKTMCKKYIIASEIRVRREKEKERERENESERIPRPYFKILRLICGAEFSRFGPPLKQTKKWKKHVSPPQN